MRVPATSDALRVARALMDISQRAAAERAAVMQKSVSAVESGKSVLLETNLALVDFYRAAGIAFLGGGEIGENIMRAGAMWSGPDGPSSVLDSDGDFRAESTSVSFRAARALLGKGQAEVAKRANVSIDTVKGLERGGDAVRHHDLLRSWYEEQGVEFTGWGDISSRRFYRVGVRWKE